MTTWTTEAVLALAPDPASAKAGSGLATAAKWESMGTDGATAWGAAKGSGKEPYQVIIDLSEPAFKCSCPSRKFPCKHGIGLFLMLAQGKVPMGAPLAFVGEWLSKRGARAVAVAEKAEKPVDEKAQAKRVEGRREKVASGLEECGLWLRDTVRQGLSSPSVATPSHFEKVAARMTDAQAPGIARRLRDMAATLHAGAGWQERLIGQMANLHLILEAYARQEELAQDLRQEVLATVGFTMKKEEIPSELQVEDRWSVVGQIRYEEDRLSVQRSWLWGQRSERWAMVLAFSVNRTPFDPMLSPGTAFEGKLAFYPGAERLRAVLVERQVAPYVSVPGSSIDHNLQGFADRLARCPWTELGPLAVADAQLAQTGWQAMDAHGFCLPTVEGYEPWERLAQTGGRPALLFGEWDGALLRPLSGFYEGRWIGA